MHLCAGSGFKVFHRMHSIDCTLELKSYRRATEELCLSTCYSLPLQVESKSAATDLEARAILHLQQLGLARVLNLRVGGRAR